MNDQLPLPGLATITAKSNGPTWQSNHLRPVWLAERVAPACADEPRAIVRYWHEHIARLPIFDPLKEHLAVLFLDTKLKCFGWNLVSIGTLNEAVAHPREIFRPVLAAACYAFALAHNHPSGNPAPSDADFRLTKRIAEGSALLCVRMVDHVIIGAGETPHFSLRESGHI